MQAFQPLPPEQTPKPPPLPSASNSLVAKIKAHKNTVILAGIGVILLSGMVTYLVISPSQKTLVAPATIEPATIPQETKKEPTTPPSLPTKTPSATPIPTLPSTSWKTYSSNAYGYSIKYPPTWTVRNLGTLEPLIPNYVVFNEPTATASARNITISISTRTYAEQLALASSGSATTVGGIAGTKQSFQDSDGNTSTVITLPRTDTLLVLRTKTKYLTIFNQMITTLQTTK